MQVGQQIGPFTLEKGLGSGAMGAVYLARYTKTRQRVALKLMAPGLVDNEMALARFEREAAILKQLQHPNIVRFFGAGRFQGTRYYAMEYVEGESLDRVMQRRGRISWEQVVTWGAQICAALQHAHEQGIIHRDLKPSNLMVLSDDTIKLADFGIAKDTDVTQLTSANCTVGTAAYMSPEQCRGERNLTHKSDLYSLGVLFYELLTGAKPFQADNAMDMFLMHVQGSFERPSRLVLDIPPWLDTLICQLLEKKPEQRPFDAGAVSSALDRVVEKVTAQQSAGADAARQRRIDRLPGSAPPDETDKAAARTLLTGTHRVRRKRRSKPFHQQLWFRGSLIAILLLLVGYVLYKGLKPASPETLFSSAEKLMASTDRDDWAQAREGPIREYLRRFPEGDGAGQMRAWRDRVDADDRERRLNVLLHFKGEPDGDSEVTAKSAVRHESAGDLEAAREDWQKLEKLKSEESREQRGWGVLASMRLLDLKQAEQQDKVLTELVKKAKAETPRPKFKPEEDWQQRIADAVNAEISDESARKARKEWERLKDEVESKKDSDQRILFLLAAKRSKELADKPAVSDTKDGKPAHESDKKPQP